MSPETAALVSVVSIVVIVYWICKFISAAFGSHKTPHCHTQTFHWDN